MYLASLFNATMMLWCLYFCVCQSLQSGPLRYRRNFGSNSFNVRASSPLSLSALQDDNTFGPPCIIIAGLMNVHLETIDDIFTAALGTLPPVIIVAKNDFTSKVTLRTLIESREERDHSLSSRGCDISSPVIIFAGCNRSAIRLSIQSYKSWNPPISGSLPRAAFAVVVPPALEKTIKDLCEEILRDFTAEQQQKLK